jgi:hypothetical protein
MRAAPLDAIYICPTSDRRYYRLLAHYVGRLDLVLVAPTHPLDGRGTPVVIDHAAQLTEAQWSRVLGINKHFTNVLESKP